MKRRSASRLRKFNSLLTGVAILLAMYLILAPVLPQFWWWGKHVGNHPDLGVVQISGQMLSQKTTPIPSGYWLDIPRLNLHQQIYTGSSEFEVNRGVWHIPGTSTPDKGSNTVVAGHRFTYTNPQGVFYFLDKLEAGDRVTVDWNGAEYTYKVIDSQVVSPTDVAINNPTKDSRFTLYTCTPLWSAKNRLVVTAELVSKRAS